MKELVDAVVLFNWTTGAFEPAEVFQESRSKESRRLRAPWHRFGPGVRAAPHANRLAH